MQRSVNGSLSPNRSVQSNGKRKRNNVTRACTKCRRKRTKCDGRTQCSTCQLHGDECVYDDIPDGRKPAARQHVEALEDRIKQLESRLEAQRQSSDRPSSPEGDSVISSEMHSSAQQSRPAQPAETARVGSLSSEQAGHLRHSTGAIKSGNDFLAHYGPSSAYMHLPDEPFHDQEDPEGEPRVRVGLGDVNWDTVQWHRHLPMGAIPSTQVHTKLLSCFFSYLNDWCQWTDERAFISSLQSSSQMVNGLRDAHYSPFFHAVILAVSTLLAPGAFVDRAQAATAATALAEHARGMIEQEVLRPLTTTVRGLMLLGTFHFHNRQRNLGWLYEGMGARVAQILGLNTDCGHLVQSGRLSERGKIHRDRTFFTVYIQDTLWSFNVGRTASQHYDDFETALPVIEAEEDALPWMNHEERMLPMAGNLNHKAGWKSTAFHWTSRLTFIADKIHQSSYRIRTQHADTNTSLISDLDAELTAWHNDLPNVLRLESWEVTTHPPWVINLISVYYYYRLLLHRPTYMSRASVQDDTRNVAEQACRNAAEELSKIFVLYRATGALAYSTVTLVNISFTAGTMFLLAAVQNHATPEEVSRAMQKVNDLIGVLGEMPWPAAGVAQDILRRLKDEWTLPRTIGTASGDELVGTNTVQTLQALQNPDSDMHKLLTSLGWVPPRAPTNPFDGAGVPTMQAFQPLTETNDSIFGNYPSSMQSTLGQPDDFFTSMGNELFTLWPHNWSNEMFSG